GSEATDGANGERTGAAGIDARDLATPAATAAERKSEGEEKTGKAARAAGANHRSFLRLVFRGSPLNTLLAAPSAASEPPVVASFMPSFAIRFLLRRAAGSGSGWPAEGLGAAPGESDDPPLPAAGTAASIGPDQLNRPI